MVWTLFNHWFFFQGKLQNIAQLQLLKYEDVLIFIVLIVDWPYLGFGLLPRLNKQK